MAQEQESVSEVASSDPTEAVAVAPSADEIATIACVVAAEMSRAGLSRRRRSWLRWRLRMRLRCLRCARRLMRGLRWRLRRHMRECCGLRKLLLLLRLVVAT